MLKPSSAQVSPVPIIVKCVTIDTICVTVFAVGYGFVESHHPQLQSCVSKQIRFTYINHIRSWEGEEGAILVWVIVCIMIKEAV